MEVCEVCGAFLIVGDAQQRVDDHLMGKQHVGYARLKEAVDEILVCIILLLHTHIENCVKFTYLFKISYSETDLY